MLEVNNLSKRYGAHTVLEISQQRFDSGVVWIKGSNGSGKSTLLKILAGLIDFKGQVIYSGNINLKKHPIAYRTLVNFAESEPLFPPFFTGWDMINLFLKTKAGSFQTLSSFIKDFDMNGYLHYEIESYSAGMMKKLSLALAFIGNPGLILLDEPFITLDGKAIDKLAEWIKKTAVLGVDFIITSHQTIPSAVPINSTFFLSNKKLNVETTECL